MLLIICMYPELSHNFDWSQVHDKSALIFGITASFLLALIIYLSIWSLLKNSLYIPPLCFLFAQPALLVRSLGICHILVHWSMTYYAQTCLEPTHKLQQFHYFMAGMNLFFVLLFLVQTYLKSDLCSHYSYGLELLFGLAVYNHWVLIAERILPNVVFGYPIPYYQDIAEVAEKLLPYYFTLIVLLNFWHKPFIDSFFFVRLFLELIFITHTCLIKTYIYTNNGWTLLMGLLMLTYYMLSGTLAPADKLIVWCWNSAALFVIAVMEVLEILTKTRIMIIFVVLLSILVFAFSWRCLFVDLIGILLCIPLCIFLFIVTLLLK